MLHQNPQIYGCVENDAGPAMKTFPAGLWVGADLRKLFRLHGPPAECLRRVVLQRVSEDKCESPQNIPNPSIIFSLRRNNLEN